MNVVSDIAGNFKTLMALIKKMPDDEVLSVGDMVDRGPRSKEVVDWFMKNGKAILGNHEHMMLDFYLHDQSFYGQGLWQYNGGGKTQISYGMKTPTEHLDWLKTLPLYVEVENCLVAHSFVYSSPYYSLKESCKLGTTSRSPELDRSIIWNRHDPVRLDEYDMQIAGHNSQFGLKHFSDQFGEFAVGIDTSREKVLTGIHLPSMEIFQQEYIDD